MAKAGSGPGKGIWGYIEGYYGRLFGWEERGAVIDHLADLGGNAYLYAPKEDSLHRRDWRMSYPAAWRKRFGESAARARRKGVDLVPGMAPGLSYDYTSAADYRRLLAKLASFRDLGCRTLALLMDDIPASLPARSRGRFRTLGEAHGRLLERLAGDLGGELWFCPTVYTDQFAAGPVAEDPYLLDLAATMPREIPIFWTGPRIISAGLGRKDIGEVSRMFGGNILLWDNLYANDYCPNKVFLGPYRGRTRETWTLSRGVLLNPTGLPATDRFLLGLLAAHREGKGGSAAADWRAAFAALDVPAAFATVARFLDTPFFRPAAADLSPRRVAACHRALKQLIWDWKGELHQEWYPYLFMLDADLKASALAAGREKPDGDWVRKRYSPLIARLLLADGR